MAPAPVLTYLVAEVELGEAIAMLHDLGAALDLVEGAARGTNGGQRQAPHHAAPGVELALRVAREKLADALGFLGELAAPAGREGRR